LWWLRKKPRGFSEASPLLERHRVGPAGWCCDRGFGFLLVAQPSGKHLALPEPTAAFLNGVVMAPITEEITFRDFYLERLQLNWISFWRCNLLTSAVFVACMWWAGRFREESDCLTTWRRRLRRCCY